MTDKFLKRKTHTHTETSSASNKPDNQQSFPIAHSRCGITDISVCGVQGDSVGVPTTKFN